MSAFQTSIPWFLNLGNHDYGGDWDYQVKYTLMPLPGRDWRWNMPGYYWTKVWTAQETGLTVQIVGIDTVQLLNHHFPGRQHRLTKHVRTGRAVRVRVS